MLFKEHRCFVNLALNHNLQPFQKHRKNYNTSSYCKFVKDTYSPRHKVTMTLRSL